MWNHIIVICLTVIVAITIYIYIRSIRKCDKDTPEYYNYVIQKYYDKHFSAYKKSDKIYEYRIFGNQMMIMSDEIFDPLFMYTIFRENYHIDYILWTKNKDEDCDYIIRKSRDKLVTIMYNFKILNKHFIICQRSVFVLSLLFYMSKLLHEQWDIIFFYLLFPYYNIISEKMIIMYTPLFCIYTTEYYNFEISYKWFFSTSSSNNMYSLTQCWIDNGTNVEHLWKCHLSAIRFYKNQYNFYTDYDMKNFIRKHYSNKILNQYDNIIPTAFKSDFFRYLYLYKYGGLYCDISMTHHVNIFELFKDKYPSKITFISAIDNGHQKNIFNALILCTPKHPILKNCIDNIMKLNKNTKRKCLDYTGPGLLGKYVKSFNNQNEIYLFQHRNSAIYNGKQLLITCKKKEKNITKNMYSESQQNHYSIHCLFNKICLY